MYKLKHILLQLPALALALFVALLSMGFTFSWEVCSDAKETPICKQEQGLCVCKEISETPDCSCADKSHNTCDLSFSKYVQFNFEVLIVNFEEFVPQLAFLNSTRNGSKLERLQKVKRHITTKYSLPPPKTGRTILCDLQTFLI